MTWQAKFIRGKIFRTLLRLFILIPVGIFTSALMQLQLFLCPSHQWVRSLGLIYLEHASAFDVCIYPHRMCVLVI